MTQPHGCLYNAMKAAGTCPSLLRSIRRRLLTSWKFARILDCNAIELLEPRQDPTPSFGRRRRCCAVVNWASIIKMRVATDSFRSRLRVERRSPQPSPRPPILKTMPSRRLLNDGSNEQAPGGRAMSRHTASGTRPNALTRLARARQRRNVFTPRNTSRLVRAPLGGSWMRSSASSSTRMLYTCDMPQIVAPLIDESLRYRRKLTDALPT